MTSAHCLYLYARLKSLRCADTRVSELIVGLWGIMQVLQSLSPSVAQSPSYRAIFAAGHREAMMIMLVVVGLAQIISAAVFARPYRQVTAGVSAFVWMYLALLVYFSTGLVPFVWQSMTLACAMVFAFALLV